MIHRTVSQRRDVRRQEDVNVPIVVPAETLERQWLNAGRVLNLGFLLRIGQTVCPAEVLEDRVLNELDVVADVTTLELGTVNYSKLPWWNEEHQSQGNPLVIVGFRDQDLGTVLDEVHPRQRLLNLPLVQ